MPSLSSSSSTAFSSRPPYALVLFLFFNRRHRQRRSGDDSDGARWGAVPLGSPSGSVAPGLQCSSSREAGGVPSCPDAHGHAVEHLPFCDVWLRSRLPCSLMEEHLPASPASHRCSRRLRLCTRACNSAHEEVQLDQRGPAVLPMPSKDSNSAHGRAVLPVGKCSSTNKALQFCPQRRKLLTLQLGVQYCRWGDAARTKNRVNAGGQKVGGSLGEALRR